MYISMCVYLFFVASGMGIIQNSKFWLCYQTCTGMCPAGVGVSKMTKFWRTYFFWHFSDWLCTRTYTHTHTHVMFRVFWGRIPTTLKWGPYSNCLKTLRVWKIRATLPWKTGGWMRLYRAIQSALHRIPQTTFSIVWCM